MSRQILSAAVVGLAVVSGGVLNGSSFAQSPTELIIQVRPGVSEQEVRRLSEQSGAEYQHALGGPAHLVRVPDPQHVSAVMDRFRSQKEVISVEPNQGVRIPE